MRETILLLILLSTCATRGQGFSWAWVNHAATGDKEEVLSVAYDSTSNSVYAAGYFKGNISAAFGSQLIISNGGEDAFLAKFDSQGNPQWSIKIGGNSDDHATSVAVAPTGNVFIAGTFQNTISVSGTSGSSQSISSLGNNDIFLASFSTTGQLLWLKHGAGSDDCAKPVLAINDSSVFIGGSFKSQINFPGLVSLPSHGGYDGFLAAYTLTGNPRFITRMGKDGDDFLKGITCSNSKVGVTGSFTDNQIKFYNAFPSSTISTMANTSTSNDDGFYACFNATNGNFNWARGAGSMGDEAGLGITLDEDRFYITGFAASGVTFYGGQSYSGFSGEDIFIVCADTTGNTLWTKFYPDNQNKTSAGTSIHASDDNLLVAGFFEGTINFSGTSALSNGEEDFFLLSLDTAGTFQWVKADGSDDKDKLWSVTHSQFGEIYTGGTFEDNFNLAGLSISGGGNENLFLAKLVCPSDTLTWLPVSGICEGDSISLSLSLSGSAAWDVYLNDGSIITNMQPGTTTSFNVSPDSTTIFSVIQAESSTGCSIDTTILPSVQVQVDPLIQNNLTAGTQTVCSGQTAALLTGQSPTGGSGNYSFLWEVLSGSWLPAGGNDTSQNYGPGILTDTTYFRRTVQSGYCNSISDTVIVNVLPAISANLISSSQVICENDLPQLLTGTNPAGGDGNYNYQWLSSSDGINFNLVGASGSSYQPPALSDTTWFRRIAASGACSGSFADSGNVISVAVQPAISGNTISAAQVICHGATPQLLTGPVPAGGSGSYQYVWETSSDSLSWINAGGNFQQQDYQPGGAPSTRWYRRIAESGACTGNFGSPSLPVRIDLFDSLANNIISASISSACQGTAGPLITGSQLSGGNQSYAYLWEQRTGTGNWQPAAGSNLLPDYSAPVISSNTEFRRRASGNCPDTLYSNPVLISALALPDGSILKNDTICEGDSVNIPVTLTGTFPFWYVFSVNNIPDSTGPVFSQSALISLLPTADSEVILHEVRNGNQCRKQIDDTLLLKVLEVPQVDAGPDLVICGKNTVLLPVNGNAVASNGLEIKNDSAFASGYSDYTISYTVSNGVCEQSDQKTLSFYPELSAESARAYGDTVLFNETSASLRATLPPERSTGNWQFIYGSGFISNADEPFTDITGLGNGEHRITYTVDNAGCDAVQDTVTIQVEELLIPQGISPNGDGFNEALFINKPEAEPLSITIFNRWGNVLFETEDYKNNWAGQDMKGGLLPSDTYFYRARYKDLPLEGYIELRR